MTDKFTISETSDYDILPKQRLGQGAFGQVYTAKKLSNNSYVAVKIIDKSKISNSQLTNIFQSEIQLLKKINHSHIVSIIDTQENQDFFYIILQKCDSDLDKLLKIKKTTQTCFTQQQSVQMIFQICQAFNYLRKLNILHRDLKPGNILIKDGILKVADFGLSKQTTSNTFCQNTAQIGTFHYMSYQVLKGLPYTQKCDVWSLGCIFYKLLHGELPWAISFENQLLKTFQNYKQQKIKILRQNLSENCKSFIQSCLRIKQHDRPSWSLLYEHPLLSQKKKINQSNEKVKKEIITLICNYDPKMIKKQAILMKKPVTKQQLIPQTAKTSVQQDEQKNKMNQLEQKQKQFFIEEKQISNKAIQNYLYLKTEQNLQRAIKQNKYELHGLTQCSDPQECPDCSRGTSQCANIWINISSLVQQQHRIFLKKLILRRMFSRYKISDLKQFNMANKYIEAQKLLYCFKKTYNQKILKKGVYFAIASLKNGQLILSMFKTHLNASIINSFKENERYEKNENLPIGAKDWILQLKQLNNDDYKTQYGFYEFEKGKIYSEGMEILQNGLYIFKQITKQWVINLIKTNQTSKFRIEYIRFQLAIKVSDDRIDKLTDQIFHNSPTDKKFQNTNLYLILGISRTNKLK